MNVITERELRELAESGTGNCVSIYCQTHNVRSEARHDPLELLDLIKDARQQLCDRGVDKREIIKIMQPAEDLLASGDLHHDCCSIALFLSDGSMRRMDLPIDVDNCAYANQHFYIKPLVPLVGGHRFFILGLSLHGSRLLECTEVSCNQVDLPKDVALSIGEAIAGEDEHQGTTFRHSLDTSNPASAGGSFHGQADIQRKEHEDRMFFFRQLDDGVVRTVKDVSLPVILAGVDSMTPFYKRASSLKNLVEECINGSPEHVSNQELHSRALQIMETIWSQQISHLMERYGTAINHQLGSGRITELLPAAMQGRIDTLMVKKGASLWGCILDGRVVIHDTQMVGDEDLIDLLTMQTVMTDGRVVAVPPEKMNRGTDVAAIYRY